MTSYSANFRQQKNTMGLKCEQIAWQFSIWKLYIRITKVMQASNGDRACREGIKQFFYRFHGRRRASTTAIIPCGE